MPRHLSSERLSVALISMLLTIVCATPATAKLTGHLFIPFPDQTQVLRFPLNDGIPAQHPDLTIPNTGSVITARLDGSVVVQISASKPELGFFAAGHTRPDRTLNLNAPPGCTVRPISLATDPRGYVYVSRQNGNCASDIAVYAPNASGNDKPVATVKINAGFIAVDPVNGEVFDSVGAFQAARTIYYFANRQHHLKPLGNFIGAAQYGQGLTINADSSFHTIWVYTAPFQYAANSLVAYQEGSNGFTVPAGGLFPDTADIAQSGDVVYSHGFYYSTFAGNNGQGVYVYHTLRRSPIATLLVSPCCPDTIAVGP
jgi:hypothetical protein